MTKLILTKEEDGKIEQVVFYEEFYRQTSEEVGDSQRRSTRYDKLKTTRANCIKLFKNLGFKEEKK